MHRQAIGIHYCVNLARQAPSRATHILAIVVRDAGSVLVHAHDDEEVPFELSERYAAAHAGPGVRLRALEDGGHYGLIDPEHPAFDEVLAALDLLAS